MNGNASCRTPSFTLGGAQVVLIGTAPMSDGGMALQFVVNSEAALSAKRDDPGGDSFTRFTTITSSVEGASVASIEAQPGATWAEAFMRVPASADQIPLSLIGPNLPETGFTVDLQAVRC